MPSGSRLFGPANFEIDLGGHVLHVLLVELGGEDAGIRLGGRIAQGLVAGPHVGDRNLQRQRLAQRTLARL